MDQSTLDADAELAEAVQAIDRAVAAQAGRPQRPHPQTALDLVRARELMERSRIREANRAVPDRLVIRSVSAWLPGVGFGARSVG